MRENAQTKAKRILGEGRVLVDRVVGDDVLARVRGDGAIHRVEHGRRGWSCSCAARGRCSHLLALGLVVAVDRRVVP